jgi:hypothetical protein
MLFRHFVSFFWTGYISFSRGSLDDRLEDASRDRRYAERVTTTVMAG